jgi:hypothetical protein
MNTSMKIRYGVALIFALSMLAPSMTIPLAASAQTQPTDNVSITDSNLSIISCDGPDMSKIPANKGKNPDVNIIDSHGNITGTTRPYKVCDFYGAMQQVQHLIDIAIVFGVVVAIGLFSYAGYLHITGTPANITKSYSIFRKVGIGFIIMLSAWFIVYQVIIWLTGGSGFAVLLGK